MKKLNLRTKMKNNFVEVPVEFIDTFMPAYSATTLKCYFYLLRASMDHSIVLSIPDLADLFDETANKIVKSLEELEKDSLIKLEYDDNEITDIVLLDILNKDSDDTENKSESKKETISSINQYSTPVSEPNVFHKAPDPNPWENPMKESFLENTDAMPMPLDFSALYADPNFMDLVALYTYHTMKDPSQKDYENLGYCYYLYNKNTEVIEHLISYCIKEGHQSTYYMKRICEAWKEHHLNNSKEVEEYIRTHNSRISSVMKAYGITGRHLVDSEIQYIDRWYEDFKEDLIILACERTIELTHTASFTYTDKILSAWKKENVKTIDDIELLDERFHREKNTDRKTDKTSKSTKDFKQRDIDMNEIAAKFYE